MRKNTGATALILPDGSRVEPGDTFDESTVPDDQLARWAGRTEHVGRKRAAAKPPPADDDGGEA